MLDSSCCSFVATIDASSFANSFMASLANSFAARTKLYRRERIAVVALVRSDFEA